VTCKRSRTPENPNQDKQMNNKLTTGDSFPALTLTTVDGTQVSLPEQLDPGSYQVILFFRGKF